jgi:3-dehydroquinate synthetase
MLHQAMEESKLHRGGDLNLPILHDIGVCGFTQTVDDGELAFAINRIQQFNATRQKRKAH